MTSSGTFLNIWKNLAAPISALARNRFRRSGRSILNRKSDLTCTVQRPLRSLARLSGRSLELRAELGGSTKRPFQNTEDGSTDVRRTRMATAITGRTDADGAAGFCALNGGGGGGKHRPVADHCRNFPPNRPPRRRRCPHCPSNGQPLGRGRTLMECPSVRANE